MIAFAKPSSSKRSAPAWHKGFLAMLPAIRRHAMVSFPGFDSHRAGRGRAGSDLQCPVRISPPVELGKTSVAYPSALARYGVAQFRAGRRVGANLNSLATLTIGGGHITDVEAGAHAAAGAETGTP